MVVRDVTLKGFFFLYVGYKEANSCNSCYSLDY